MWSSRHQACFSSSVSELRKCSNFIFVSFVLSIFVRFNPYGGLLIHQPLRYTVKSEELKFKKTDHLVSFQSLSQSPFVAWLKSSTERSLSAPSNLLLMSRDVSWHRARTLSFGYSPQAIRLPERCESCSWVGIIEPTRINSLEPFPHILQK